MSNELIFTFTVVNDAGWSYDEIEAYVLGQVDKLAVRLNLEPDYASVIKMSENVEDKEAWIVEIYGKVKELEENEEAKNALKEIATATETAVLMTDQELEESLHIEDANRAADDMDFEQQEQASE